MTFEVNQYVIKKKSEKWVFLFYYTYFIGKCLSQYSESEMKKKELVRRKHQNMSFPKFLLDLYPFISILRLKISLLDEHCFNP